jgi:ABC-type transport system involved in cytochrome c biogenesis ATPase subunit
MNLSREFISDHLQQNGIAVVATHQDLNMGAARGQRLQLS